MSSTDVDYCLAIFIGDFYFSKWCTLVFRTHKVIDDVKHRRLLVSFNLRMNNRNDVDYNSLTRKMFVYQVSFNQYLSTRWLSTTGYIFRNFLNLNPLVIDHSRDIHHEVEASSARASCGLTASCFIRAL